MMPALSRHNKVSILTKMAGRFRDGIRNGRSGCFTNERWVHVMRHGSQHCDVIFFTKGPPATSAAHVEQGFCVVWRWALGVVVGKGYLGGSRNGACNGPSPPRFWALVLPRRPCNDGALTIPCCLGPKPKRIPRKAPSIRDSLIPEISQQGT